MSNITKFPDLPRVPRRVPDPRDIDLKTILGEERYAKELERAPLVAEPPDLRIGSITPPPPIEPPPEAHRGQEPRPFDEGRIKVSADVFMLPDGQVKIEYARDGQGNPITQLVAKGVFEGMVAGCNAMLKAISEQNTQEEIRRKDLANNQENKEGN